MRRDFQNQAYNNPRQKSKNNNPEPFCASKLYRDLGVDISGFPNVQAHFKRMHERPRLKRLLAYEKEVNETFARTA